VFMKSGILPFLLVDVLLHFIKAFYGHLCGGVYNLSVGSWC
jgi:hypothetical protein